MAPDDPNLDVLREAIHAAREGHGGSVLVTGVSGSGKTALADRLCRGLKETEGTVLWASCDAAPDAPGFWPWLQFLRQYMRGHQGHEFSEALQARMADIIDMAPGVDQVLGGGPVPAAIDVETARFRLLDAVTQALRQAGDENPVLLVLDDLHAADESTLALLKHVAGELWGARVTLLALTRPVSPRSAIPLKDAVEALARSRGSRRVQLAAPARASGRRSAVDLSAREIEVARLVSEGLTNRDIAGRIFISERTAENHVQNILNKLGLTSRTQVAAMVARGDL